MRARLFLLLLTLLICVIAALQLPLAFSSAVSAQQRVFIDRLNDVDRFAGLANDIGEGGDTESLTEELRRYDEVYGVSVVVLGTQRQVRAASRSGIDLETDQVQTLLDIAYAGRRAEGPLVQWPWDSRPLVVAGSYGRGGEVAGVVLTLSPTDKYRDGVWRTWAVQAIGGLFALVVFAVVAAALARWILRPVANLDSAAQRLASGALDHRVPERSGPPELRHLARSFNTMAATVTASLEQQRGFVAEASHQMRNPLTALRLRLDNLEPDLPADAQREYQELQHEGERLQRVLEELLTLARAEKHLGSVRAEEVGPLLDERLGAWHHAADARDLLLIREGKANAVAVVDAEAMSRVLDEVLGNAVKYASEGGQISATLSEDADAVRIMVCDDGEGLAAEELSRATDRFWRSRRHSNVPGTGLGLAIASSALASFGARLEVKAGKPKGLAVTLVLPKGQR